ncbi:methyltransferase domain-containing protein [Cyanobacteria bacterium FACHB-502]|nr:methyltransferase domain-containing protein [Cyanobacteria bacterium FACHB-502]
MMNQLELNDYKQGVADSYDRRSQTYDNSEWHVQICRRLLEYSQVGAGQTVLDIGTGTGHIAIAAAQIVGAQGQVIGIDISAGMLEQAQSKVSALGLSNVEFQLTDAEALEYPAHHFDRILCANTFPWMQDKEATLRMWYRFLKPGGRIGVHTPADTAYVGAVVLRKVFAKYGVSLEASNRIGSVEQCQDLFTNAGFEAVDIGTELHGSYTNLEKAKATWEEIVGRPSSTSLKVLGNGLSQLSSAQLAQAKAEFDAELESFRTKEGIWDNLTTLYILAGNRSSR